ncbi:hypothetical protein [Providencia sp. PROV202]|uniref:hypothetical protein n=1 Tax=Providencia sp. PROV202 TaxID=2949902 RepID=UPI00234A25F9|nr:hypothetical protein [Providencia sp. PROV202]
MSTINLQKEMLLTVAKALGNELLQQVTFVGGCTTGLFVTDEFTKEQVRYTDDVDLIVNIMGYAKFAQLQETLRYKGFKEDPTEDVICRMLLGELKVDFMPIDEQALGFSNSWYKKAAETALDYTLESDIVIKLIRPEYFIATKLEAYLGRGNGDLLSSHDIEDILNLFDGRESIVVDISHADTELKNYISEELSKLIEEYDFEMVVQSATQGDRLREDIIYSRLNECIN